MTKPPNFLGVRKAIGSAGYINPEDQVYVDILEVESPSGNIAGIVSVGTIPGLVPFFEEHIARRKAGYTLPQWRELDWIDRAIEVAMLRVEAKIESIQAEEQKP